MKKILIQIGSAIKTGFALAAGAYFLSGCASTTSRLLDTRDRDNSQHVLDNRACTRTISYFHGHPITDQEFFFACMDKLGYQYQVVTTEVGGKTTIRNGITGETVVNAEIKP